MAMRLLPWAVVAHFAFAVWAFSAYPMATDPGLETMAVPWAIEAGVANWNTIAPTLPIPPGLLGPRLTQRNAAPMLGAAVVLIVVSLLRAAGADSLIEIGYAFLFGTVRGHRGRNVGYVPPPHPLIHRAVSRTRTRTRPF